MPHDRDRTPPGWIFWAIISFTLVVLLYPLSVGPVASLVYHDLVPDSWVDPINDFYSPVFCVAGSSDWAGAAWSWYVHLWVPAP